MADSDKERENRPPLKVSDRRHFDADGEPRKRDPSRDDEAEGSPEPRDEAAGAREEGPTDGSHHEGVRYPVSFRALLAPFYLEALVHLGLEPHPETGNRTVDLDAARVPIELLSLLEEKTKGRLEESEEAELRQALYQLRLLYVERTSGPKGS